MLLIPISNNSGNIMGYNGDPKAFVVANTSVILVYYALQVCIPEQCPSLTFIKFRNIGFSTANDHIPGYNGKDTGKDREINRY